MSPHAPTKFALIAIVEDDKAVLDALEFTLKTQGYAVCTFARGREALYSRRIMLAQCLVIDYMIPDMDGIALLRGLRQRGVKCPAIIITGNLTTQCRKGALAAGARVLEKPLMDDVVGHSIREALALA